MDGIDFQKSEDGALSITITELSNELRMVIRDRLSSICNGAAKASRNPVLYSYRRTLTAFFAKYDSWSNNTQKGVIGELLTHILLLHFEDDFYAASPHYNMEEDSIKKGFDLVLTQDSTNEIWFVEVKAGNSGENTTAEKLGSLLSIAKNDLKGNLNSERNTLWQNAVNGASITLKNPNLKEQVEAILEGFNLKAVEGTAKSTDYNAILVAVCYSGDKPFATHAEFNERHKNQKEMGEFKALLSLSMQKDTYSSVADFLREEAEDGEKAA